MSYEKIPLTSGSNGDGSFYTGEERSIGSAGAGGLSRRLLHGLTIVSVLVAGGCTIYGSVEAKSGAMLLPAFVVSIWLIVHCVLLYFARNEQHDFHPPGWFVFVSSAHIVIQAIVVIVLTLFKKEN